MDKLLNIFSTRELSIFIWLGIVLIIMLFNKGFRESFGGVLKIFFDKTIGTILLMLTVYVGFILFVLYKIDFWNFSFLKDTIFWFFTTALISFFVINKAKTISYFKDFIKENLKGAIVIEFIVSFYTFSLVKELIFVPAMFFLGMLQAFAQIDKKNIQVKKFLDYLIAIISIALLVYVTYKTFENYQDFFTVHNLFSFLLPLLLTIFLVPFLYWLAVYINYEELFARVNCMTDDKEKRIQLKREIKLVAILNLNRLNSISKNLNKFYWYHSDDIKTYVKSLIKGTNDMRTKPHAANTPL
jgi:hypothetical protein